MEIVDHALHALSDEVMVPHSGWENTLKDQQGEELIYLSNRNVSSERSEARRKLRECSGLVDALVHIVQLQIDRKDVDCKVLYFFSVLIDTLDSVLLTLYLREYSFYF
ncbi:CTND1 protein, partial [Polypterus senegalus]|nr:CTND1 protein [Polypterus senegalus]